MAPGKPAQGAFIETLNGRLSDKSQYKAWLVTLQGLQGTIALWPAGYDWDHPHGSVQGLTPTASTARGTVSAEEGH